MLKKIFIPIFALELAAAAFLLLRSHNFALFTPKGQIAEVQTHLISLELITGIVIAITVLFAAFLIITKYREGGGANYEPESTNNPVKQIILWAIPTGVILFLAGITWTATHTLDPRKPIITSVKPITIQVISLRWKWLFIYPEAGIASVNFVQFPVNTPIEFELTADSPMNSFWIPQLGGQIYAMPGMGTFTHLIASEVGDYSGSTAEMSGAGFAGMRFVARASTAADFDNWVQIVQNLNNNLDLAEYNKLETPSENTPVSFYGSTQYYLYNEVMMKFTMPPHS